MKLPYGTLSHFTRGTFFTGPVVFNFPAVPYGGEGGSSAGIIWDQRFKVGPRTDIDLRLKGERFGIDNRTPKIASPLP